MTITDLENFLIMLIGFYGVLLPYIMFLALLGYILKPNNDHG